MKALWIRVEAHEVDSVRIAQLAQALDVDVVQALGHYVALGGGIAEHSPDGLIADVPEMTIERWGRWSGKRGRFAAAIRELLQTDDGEFSDWTESMGKLVERRAADRERQEERRRKIKEDRDRRATAEANRPRKVRGQSVDSPRNDRGESAATERNGTERNGTERNGTGESLSTSRVINSGSLQSEKGPAFFVGATVEQLVAFLPPITKRWLERYYPKAETEPAKRHDKALQLAHLADGRSVTYRKQLVWAYDAERLDRKCEEMLEVDPPIDGSALAYLFVMLGDTSDNSAPGVKAAAAIDPEPSDIERAMTDKILAQMPRVANR